MEAAITVRILEPVQTASLRGYDVRRLRDEVHDRIGRALDEESRPAAVSPSC